MIWTVTLNPAIDHIYVLSKSVDSKACMAEASAHVPAGKGVNVSRALAGLGSSSTAVVLVSESELAAYEASLRALPASSRCVALLPFVRHHTTLIWQDRRPPLHVRELGPAAPAESLDAVRAALADVGEADDVAFCGSLAPGLPESAYAELVAQVQSLGARAWLDAAGPALAAGMRARPFAVKVNRQEAAAHLGMAIENVAEAVAAAIALLRQAQEFAAVTLGPDGLVLASQRARAWALSPAERVVNGVGSGDAALAGLISAWQAGGAELEMAKLAAAAASASMANVVPAAIERLGLAWSLAACQSCVEHIA